mmetsp:Transcript_20270/g.37867  ORF Transcript_20270/g.37867 Transcript_20270/m.37867 type:complete len:403 (-) Transcript_20270:1415-2623(-)
MYNSCESLALLLAACLVNRAQFYVMPMLASDSTLLDDIDTIQLKYYEVSNVLCFFVVAFLPIPLGFLADFFKELKMLITLALASSNLISILAASSTNSSLFYFSQVSNCIVSSILFPAVVKHLSTIWSAHHHAFIFSCLVSATPLGYTLTTLTIPFCSWISWRLVLVVYALTGLTLCFLYYTMTQGSVVPTNLQVISKTIKSSLVGPVLFLIGFGLFFRWCKGGVEGFNTDILMTFFPQESYGVSLKLVGTCLASVVASLLVGIASDWFYPSVRESRILAICCSSVISMLALVTACTTSSYDLSNAAVAIFYITVDSYFGAFIALAVEYTIYEIRGFTLGIILCFGFLGSIYQTLAFHSLVDRFGSVSQVSLIFLCVNYSAALACFLALCRCKGNSKHYNSL